MLSRTHESTREPSITLTLVKDPNGNPSMAIQVHPAQMITYDQKLGYTRLRLTGNRVMEVKEGTDQIDRLIRAATANLVRQ